MRDLCHLVAYLESQEWKYLYGIISCFDKVMGLITLLRQKRVFLLRRYSFLNNMHPITYFEKILSMCHTLISKTFLHSALLFAACKKSDRKISLNDHTCNYAQKIWCLFSHFFLWYPRNPFSILPQIKVWENNTGSLNVTISSTSGHTVQPAHINSVSAP